MRSKFEKTINASLKKKQGILYKYEPKDDSLEYTLIKKYIPDFVLTSKDKKHKIFIEAKGYFRPADRDWETSLGSYL